MPAMTPFGRSLHIGVNHVQTPRYANYHDGLVGAENDAEFMAEVARARGFSDRRMLLAKDATAAAVLSGILDAADALPPDSFFLLTFAGHGIQTPNLHPERGDPENLNQNWCLYDRALLDNELRRICWPKFKKDTRVLVVIDACHSGSSVKNMQFHASEGREAFESRSISEMISGSEVIERINTRELPEKYVLATYEQNYDQYESILSSLPSQTTEIVAQVLSLAACHDQERAADGPHGAFTQAIKEVWDGGNFVGTHHELMTAVKALVTARYPAQHPFTCCPPLPLFHGAAAFRI
jgi:metacaspase-1